MSVHFHEYINKCMTTYRSIPTAYKQARAWTQREKQTRREKERHMIDRQMTGSMCSSLRRRAGTMLYCAKAMANHGAPGAEGVILFDCIVL